MSACFDISAASGSYSLTIDPGALHHLLADKADVCIIADEYFEATLRDLGCEFIMISAHEDSKSLVQMPSLIEELRRRGVSRNTSLIALGGGITQDISGFVASVYMRGLPWTYIPTTLLGMADSCIGGKSSINVGPYKNIVGTFHPPSAILIDPKWISTLSYEMRVAGLCEIAKIAYCHGHESFDEFCALGVNPDSDIDVFASAIELSIRSKKWFIEVDEFDRAERLLLNFGHTFGHAIESASDFQISHGIAVGLGMLAAFDFARNDGLLPDANSRIVELVRIVRHWLGALPGLEPAIATLEADRLIEAFLSDKKHSQESFAVIVPTQNDGIARTLLPKSEESIRSIRAAFTSLKG